MAKTAKQEQFSDEDLEGLGPEELKALGAGPDDDDDDDADLDDDDLDSDEDDEEEGDEDDDDADEDDDSDDDADDDDADEDDDNDDDDDGKKKPGENDEDDDDSDDDLPASSKLPRYAIDEADVKEATKTLETIKDESKAIKAKFSEGDITEDEYHDQMEDLNDRKYEARRTIDRAEQKKEYNEANAGKEWELTQEAFYSMDGNEVFKTPALQASLQLFLDQVAADEANANKSTLQLLKMAAKLVRQDYADAGITIGAAKKQGRKTDKRTPAQRELDRRRQRRDKANDDVDKTLSNKTKAGDSDGKFKGRFAHLEDLSGMELEEAVAAMSDADQDAWLAR